MDETQVKSKTTNTKRKDSIFCINLGSDKGTEEEEGEEEEEEGKSKLIYTTPVRIIDIAISNMCIAVISSSFVLIAKFGKGASNFKK